MAESSVGKYQMVAIGGSAGSLEVIMKIVSLLPQTSNASFVIIVHRKSGPDSILQELLSSKTSLPVREIEDKEIILPGTIYIAPPDYHVLFEDENSFSLDASEKINHSRPSIDIAFESAAEVFGSSLIGILLSGANADGAEGLKKIAEAGGYTIIQDPLTADVGFMPQQALNLVTPDAIVQGDEIGTFLQNIV